MSIWCWCREKLNWPCANTNQLIILSEMEGIKNRFDVKCRSLDIAKVAFSTTVWCLWQERNQRVFAN